MLLPPIACGGTIKASHTSVVIAGLVWASPCRFQQRVLGEQPAGLARVSDLPRRGADAAPWAGRGVYSGLRSLGFPGHPLADLWQAADLLREHRGDSHVIALAVGGADAVDIPLLTEQW